MLRELTKRALEPAVDWSAVPAALCGESAAVRQGLYVFVFANRHASAVYDNPGDERRRKVVIRDGGVAVKPGKFENGFVTRVRDYNFHLHRRREGNPQLCLRECFEGGFLLNLEGAVSLVGAPAKIFERYWAEAIDRYLETHGLLAGRRMKRAEWRHVEPSGWSEPGVQPRFRAYLEGLGERIFEMARIGEIPPPTSA